MSDCSSSATAFVFRDSVLGRLFRTTREPVVCSLLSSQHTVGIGLTWLTKTLKTSSTIPHSTATPSTSPLSPITLRISKHTPSFAAEPPDLPPVACSILQTPIDSALAQGASDDSAVRRAMTSYWSTTALEGAKVRRGMMNWWVGEGRRLAARREARVRTAVGGAWEGAVRRV